MNPELREKFETQTRQMERFRMARLIPVLSSDPIFCREIAEGMDTLDEKIRIHCVDDRDNFLQQLHRLDMPIGAVIVDVDDSPELADWLVDLDVPAGCLKFAASEYRQTLHRIRSEIQYMELFRFGKGTSVESLHDTIELRSLCLPE